MSGTAAPQLVLLSPAGEVGEAPIQLGLADHVRVLTWNVQPAAASRTHQQAAWLAKADPHEVLVLTEVAAGESGLLLARLLCEFGYTVHLPDAGEDKYRVLIACRIAPATYHERILNAAHHVGSNLDAHRELIAALPAAEPNRLRAVLSTISPAQIIVTGTLDRRLLFLKHPRGDRPSVNTTSW